MGKILCVDLGTTFSCMSVQDDGGEPIIIPNSEGDKTTPSAVLIEDSNISVGQAALYSFVLKPNDVIRWIKLSMYDTEFLFKGMNPIEISAEILKKLKRDAEDELGQEIQDAVITCPAYFSADEVENTKEAGRLAGLNVLEIIKEPTAAAAYWGFNNLKEGERLLVCDLGGGTYDAVVMECISENGQRILRPQPSAGDRELGGHHWTEVLKEHVAGLLIEQFGSDPCDDLTINQMMYDLCEQGKRTLQKMESIEIPCTYQDQTKTVTVTRADFEEKTEHLIERMLLWNEVAIGKCDPPITKSDIDHILLVGGSSRLRRVPEALEQEFGKKPIQTGKPDFMVALGAAIMAGEQKKTGLTIMRTTSRHLGTKVLGGSAGEPELVNSVIIPMGSDISRGTTASQVFETASANQKVFDLPIVEFDDSSPERIQSTWRFACEPNTPKGSKIEVSYNYDPSGIIDVAAVDLASGKDLPKDKIIYEEPDLTATGGGGGAITLVFAIDVSWSMEGGKIQGARRAVSEAVDKIFQSAGPGSRVGLVTFGSSAQVVCGLTSDPSAIKSAVSGIGTSGTTAMNQGITTALNLIQSESGEGARWIAIATDGMPDDQGLTLDAAQAAAAAGVELSIVSIGQDDVDQDYLGRLSGNIFEVDDMANLGEALVHSVLAQASASGASDSGVIPSGAIVRG